MDSSELTQMDIVRSLRRLPLPMPRDLGEVFQVLGLYDPRDGLESLIGRLDLAGVQPKQIYTAVLGRAPDDIATATPRKDYDPTKHFLEALQSREFQHKSIRNLLSTISAKRRDIFIHIPKCAGTDLILNLAPNRLSIPRILDFEEWVSKEDFFSSVAGLMQAESFYSDVFVYGHMQVGEYFDLAGLRPSDRIFTVIRDPAELLLSQANYAVARLCQDPDGAAFDTRDIMNILGINKLPEGMTPQQLKRLAISCLLNQRISQPDRICYYLGKGGHPSYRQAIEHLVTYDIEITNTRNYQRWLSERWGIQPGTRHNESEKFLSLQEARRFFPGELQAGTSEDRKLFEVIEWVLAQTGGSSTRGSEVAEVAGADLLEDLPERLEKERLHGRTSMVTVQSPEFIMQLEAPIPADLTKVRMIVESDYSFSEGGNAREIIGAGWSVSEAKFTWTCSQQSVVKLPQPNAGGAYVLRIRCSPYVVNELWPCQRVVVLINGQEVGSAKLNDVAVIDCDMQLEDGVGALELILHLPDAVSPVTLGQGDDDRLLGLAVSSMTLLRLSYDAAVASDDASEPAIPPLHSLLLAFESLGENCELGLVQRRCEAEPLGLFRFSSAPLPRLLEGLRAGFKGMGRPENIEVQVSSNGSEYMVLDKRFGFLSHAWVPVGEMEPDEIAVREARRLPLLTRKLIEDITLGEKIFVYHGMEALTLDQAQALVAVLRSYGPATLLWVELADELHSPGTVEQIQPGLLKGYMDRFAPGENAHDLSLDCWITVCRNAYRIWKSA
jgi:hypothetical protein